MGKISSELSMVYDTAYKLFHNLDNTDITCMNFLLAMAINRSCFSHKILDSKGFTKEVAESFIIERAYLSQRKLSRGTEKVLIEANEIATAYGYGTVYSHHLLLAMAQSKELDIMQILSDYNITKAGVKTIVDAIHHNKIENKTIHNKDNKNIKLYSSIKNKDLEKRIIKILKDTRRA